MIVVQYIFAVDHRFTETLPDKITHLASCDIIVPTFDMK